MARYKILSTKKLQPELLQQAAGNDIEIIEQEFISIQPILSSEKYQEVCSYFNKGYIAVTSAQAAAMLGIYLHWKDATHRPDWKIFCLSGKTKDAMLQAFAHEEDIIATADNAIKLADKVKEQGITEIVFFCGNKRRDELPEQLKKAGITVREVMVYETVETPAPVAQEMDAILFFSPLGVTSFFRTNQPNKGTVCFAIGQTTAEAIAVHTGNTIIISESPSQEKMLAGVQKYFNQLRQAEK